VQRSHQTGATSAEDEDVSCYGVGHGGA
jgi:hypothetical protein